MKKDAACYFCHKVLDLNEISTKWVWITHTNQKGNSEKIAACVHHPGVVPDSEKPKQESPTPNKSK